MPQISVIIPVYNTEKYLKECLDSIINQTLKEIEIICVNDGSTDGSLDILNEYAAKDSRIKIINQANQGAGVARNTGISNATGEYLSILDADDIFESNMLETMLNKAKKTDSDITICRSKALNNQTKQCEDMPWTLKFLPNKDIFSYKDFLPYHVFDFCIGWSWDKLYKTNFVKENHLEFQNLRSTNDAFFVFTSLCLANSMSIVNDILITHRTNTNTQLSETRDKDHICFIEAIKAIKTKLNELHIYSEVEKSFISWAVNFCFWHLNTLSINNANSLIKQLNILFNDLGIYGKPINYFNDKNQILLLNCLKTEDICLYNITRQQIDFNTKQDKISMAIERIKNKNTFIENIFSVKNRIFNNSSYKVITILGIKIKFRRKTKNG